MLNNSRVSSVCLGHNIFYIKHYCPHVILKFYKKACLNLLPLYFHLFILQRTLEYNICWQIYSKFHEFAPCPAGWIWYWCAECHCSWCTLLTQITVSWMVNVTEVFRSKDEKPKQWGRCGFIATDIVSAILPQQICMIFHHCAALRVSHNRQNEDVSSFEQDCWNNKLFRYVVIN